jgi:2-C-methyl-D-erythritol 4-phosphate cytidylyltransferase
MAQGAERGGQGRAFCSAVIVAAGSSRRMGFNKLLAPLCGVPVLRRALEAFQKCDAVDEIIVVAGDEVGEAVESWCRADGGVRAPLRKLRGVIAGGEERHLSVWAGLQAVSAQAAIIAVHDGGRPLITPGQIARCIEAACEHGGATSARPVTETMKRADDAGCITESIERRNAWIMETPQVFRRDLLMRAYEKVMRDGALVTDEVSAMQHLGERVIVVSNESPNPKITFPSDLEQAEKWLA